MSMSQRLGNYRELRMPHALRIALLIATMCSPGLYCTNKRSSERDADVANAPPRGPTAPVARIFPLVRQVTLEEPPEGLLVNPIDLSVTANGYAVADIRGPDVKLYSLDGEFRALLGRSGNGPGEFYLPISLASLPGNRLAVVDFGLGRVTVFAPDNEVQLVFRTKYFYPTSIRARGNELLILSRETVKDGWRDVLQLYDGKGRLMRTIDVGLKVPIQSGMLSRTAWSRFDIAQDGSILAGAEFSDSAIIQENRFRRTVALGGFSAAEAPTNDLSEYITWRQRHPVLERIFAVRDYIVGLYTTWEDNRRNIHRFLQVYTRDGVPAAPIVRSPGLLLEVRADTLYFIDRDSVPRVLQLRTLALP